MSWNRCTLWVLRGLVAFGLTGLVGCKQQLFLDPQDYSNAVTVGLPRNLTENPHDAITPQPVQKIGEVPATVINPSLPPRYVTLKECIAVALEQGNVGIQQQTSFGFKNEISIVQFTGTGVTGTDAIRAFALDPANIQANIERSLSKFDARWITSMQWQKNDNPVAAQFVSFQAQNDTAAFSTALVKPLPTGGLAGITFNTNYTKFQNIPPSQAASFVNPNYQPQLQFVFEQPLLQLFGVEVNQLTSQNPTSLLIQGLRPSGGQGVEGILITRIRFDQAKADFERVVNYLLVNVEEAYWNLYASYYNLYAQEEGLRQSYEGYRFTRARVEAGTDPPQQLDQSRAQLELFRSQVYTARGQVLENERQLRGLMGLRSDDGKRLVPVDEPNLAPFQPDFYEAANEAVALRPELLLARQDLKAQQLNLVLQKNLRRPDLRFFSSYNVAGLGTRLDGPEVIYNSNGSTLPGNALSNFANDRFNSWTLGMRMDMPLGFRDANAQVRQAQLQITRSYVQLRDAELKVLEYLASRYRRLVQTYAVIPPLRARREALQLFVHKFRIRVEIGAFQSTEYFNFLQVQRDLADAVNQEFSAIAQYNSALAEFEFAKGTIQRYNNINVADGPLPPWVQKRAADHERERTSAALKLRERQAHDPSPVSPPHGVGPAVGAPTLPPLTQMPPSPDIGPAPKPLPPGATPATPPGTAPAPLPLPRPNENIEAGGAMPAPVGNAGTEFPNPNEIFTPTGTMSMPRMQPLPVRVPGGSGAEGASVPPGNEGPTAPLPPGVSIPPTLPPSGIPGVPRFPAPSGNP